MAEYCVDFHGYVYVDACDEDEAYDKVETMTSPADIYIDRVREVYDG